MRELVFEGVPDKDAAVFGTAVILTLDELGIEYEYDETSPPNEKGEVTYKVVGVKHEGGD